MLARGSSPLALGQASKRHTSPAHLEMRPTGSLLSYLFVLPLPLMWHVRHFRWLILTPRLLASVLQVRGAIAAPASRLIMLDDVQPGRQ